MSEKLANCSKLFSIWSFSLETIIRMGISLSLSLYDIIGGWGCRNLLSENDSTDFFQVRSNVASHLVQDELVRKLSVTQMSSHLDSPVLCVGDSTETEGPCCGQHTGCPLY